MNAIPITAQTGQTMPALFLPYYTWLETKTPRRFAFALDPRQVSVDKLDEDAGELIGIIARGCNIQREHLGNPVVRDGDDIVTVFYDWHAPFTIALIFNPAAIDGDGVRENATRIMDLCRRGIELARRGNA